MEDIRTKLFTVSFAMSRSLYKLCFLPSTFILKYLHDMNYYFYFSFKYLKGKKYKILKCLIFAWESVSYTLYLHLSYFIYNNI